MRSLADRLNEQARADADDRELTSRTDRRREQNARETELKALAVALVALKRQKLEQLALDEELLNAVLSAQAIKSANAKNRQVGVVRQHLRDLGPAVQDLVARLEARERGVVPHKPSLGAENEAATAAVEMWMKRLAADGDVAVDELVRRYPQAERQLLRQRTRAVVKAMGTASPLELERTRARLRLDLERFVDAAPDAGI